MLVTYFLFCLILFVCQVVVAWVALTHYNDMKGWLHDQWFKSMDAEDRAEVEKEFDCCGFESGDDPTCDAKTPGCYEALKDDVEKYMRFGGYTCLALAIFQFIILLCSCGLIFGLRRVYKEKHSAQYAALIGGPQPMASPAGAGYHAPQTGYAQPKYPNA